MAHCTYTTHIPYTKFSDLTFMHSLFDTSLALQSDENKIPFNRQKHGNRKVYGVFILH